MKKAASWDMSPANDSRKLVAHSCFPFGPRLTLINDLVFLPCAVRLLCSRIQAQPEPQSTLITQETNRIPTKRSSGHSSTISKQTPQHSPLPCPCCLSLFIPAVISLLCCFKTFVFSSYHHRLFRALSASLPTACPRRPANG